MSSRHFEADRVEDIALMNTIRRLLVSTRTITVNAGGGGGTWNYFEISCLDSKSNLENQL